MARAKQTVIVSKQVAKSRAEAAKIAAHVADKLYTSRETSTSFRFRQRPPSDFVPGSFRTKSAGKTKIVWGELK